MIDLNGVYRRALDACRPEVLIRQVRENGLPRDVVAIGKCAGALLDGYGERGDAFVALPRGYPHPRSATLIHEGSHPELSRDSFDAGRALIEFIDEHAEITFLVSGGGSACVESPLAPWFDEHDLIDANARLLRSGLPIGDINCVRKHLSAIKGGRLGARVTRRSATLVYSDVSIGALADVASGPTIADSTSKQRAIAILIHLVGCDGIVTKLRDENCPETVKRIENTTTHLIADNATLTAAAASIVRQDGFEPVMWDGQIEGDVADAAAALARAARQLPRGHVLIAGGEPTVRVHGTGRGGRCSELAVRFALRAAELHLDALFASSDGVDGNSGAAGVRLHFPASLDRGEAERQLAASNSMEVARSIGDPIPLCPTGNNLRDLYLLASS